MTWGVLVCVAAGAWFTATAVALGDGGQALEVVLGLTSPYDRGHPVLTVPLAVAGWLAVPALVGTVVSLVIERQIEHQRMTARDMRELEDRIRREIESLRQL